MAERKAIRRRLWLALPVALLLGTWAAKAGPGGLMPQKFSDFTTPLPLPEGDTLVIGFLGGWENWDDAGRGVRRFALDLREDQIPGLHVETVENHRRKLGLELVEKALDRDRDGKLSDAEKQSARIILYGQSFGGAAVNKLSRELEKLGVPVLLSVQIDSVGRGDGLVPANVRRAVNFYQRNDHFLIRGEDDFRAADPSKTYIIGNFRWDYSSKKVDLSSAHAYQKIFRNAHVKMEQDPDLWTAVRHIILDELKAR